MKRLVWLSGGLLAALCIPLLLGGTDSLVRLKAFPLSLWAAMLGMILLCWCLNTARLRLLLGPCGRGLGLRRSLGTVMATEFAICATPGGSGGPLALMAVLARNGVGAAKSSAVFATDQLADLLFFMLALAGILLYGVFHNLGSRLEWMLAGSFGLLLAGLVLIACFARYHRPLLLASGKLMRRLGLSATRCRRWARKLLHFRDALSDTLRMPPGRLLVLMALTCAHWTLRYSVLYLAVTGLGKDIQWAWTFLVQMVALSAGQFSLLPGGAGTAELTSAAMLAPLVGKSSAAAAILIWRTVTYYFYLIAGGPMFIWLVGRPLLLRLMRVRQA